jgi:diacylglycerol kinase family enzyme
MTTSYEVWDTDTGNLIRSYTSEDDALALVRAAVERRGRRAVAKWALVEVGGDGSLSTVAAGLALAGRAMQSLSA